MTESEEEVTLHKRTEGHRVLKTWKTTSNLAQKAVLDAIAHEASRYDLLRDGAFVRQCFGGGPMTPEVFKRQLQVAFHIKFSDAEVAEAAKVLDTNKNGVIEAEEFLKAFFEMGAAEKARRHRSNLEQRKREVEKQAADIKRKEDDAQAKAARVAIEEFKQEDLESAIAKVKHAALVYDRYHPSSVQLDAFETRGMPPHEFRNQLKRCFNLHPSPAEFGALLSYFDKEGRGSVDGVEFLVAFFRTGFSEKAKQWIDRRDRELRKQEARLQEERKKKEAADAKNALKVSYEFSAEEEASALRKLTLAAVRYDRNAPGAMGLEAFEGKDMPPHVFKEQLKMTFNLKVTPGELGALMKAFDGDGSGCVSTSEFLVDFFRRGFEGRHERIKRTRDKQARRQAQRMSEESRKKAEADAKNALQVKGDYQPSDFDSALHKITEAALRYDKYHPSCIPLTAFEGASLAPHEFKDQLRRVLNLQLTPAELGALMAYFDRDGDGTVACQEFLILFFKTGFKERNRLRREWRRRQSKQEEARLAKIRADTLAQDTKNALMVKNDFAQTHFDLAIGKITQAAARYDRYHPSSVQLDAFEGASMPPHVFKEQLRRVFNVRLGGRELGAVMSHFDKDGSGEVDCAEFLLEFFKLGFEERSRRLKIYRRKQAVHAAKARQEAERRAKTQLHRELTAASAFSEEELDSAVSKLLDAALNYSQRNLGTTGFKPFQEGDLAPGEFARQLKHTFHLQLCPGELGAVTAYFDRDGDGAVAYQEFLAQFFRLELAAKPFAGKPDSRRQLRELKEVVKAQIRARQYDFSALTTHTTTGSSSNNQQEEHGVGPETEEGEGEGATRQARTGSGNSSAAQTNKRRPPALTPRSKIERRLSRAEALLSCPPLPSISLLTMGSTPHPPPSSQQTRPQGQGRVVLDLSSYGGGGVREGCDFCLTDMPTRALHLTGLTELWLSNNALTCLPSSLCPLPFLTVLGLSNNQLTALPLQLAHMPRLQCLYADRNLITDVPLEVLGGCALILKELRLDHNPLHALPTAIPALRNLEVLGLSHTGLTGTSLCSMGRGRLCRLQSLDLDGNAIQGPLPASLYALAPNLRSLSLTANAHPLDTQASVWSGFPKLQSLRLGPRLNTPFASRPLTLPNTSPEGSVGVGVGVCEEGPLWLGGQYVGLASEGHAAMVSVIKRRKLLANNYILHKTDA